MSLIEGFMYSTNSFIRTANYIFENGMIFSPFLANFFHISAAQCLSIPTLLQGCDAFERMYIYLSQ